MPPRAVQGALRELFSRWGLPERVRVDNGWPWGSSSDLPPALALWLIGLGVGVVYNPPRCPQDNGVVERFHGLIEPWGEPEKCTSFAAWQERLAWLSRIQRECYPAIGGHSRLQAFPGLSTEGRPYNPLQEARGWNLEPVKGYLAQGVWRRRVDKVGRITLYHRPYQVGRPYKRQDVFVRFDPELTAWVFLDQAGREICRRVAQEITTESIVNLEVSHSRPACHSSQSDTTF